MATRFLKTNCRPDTHTPEHDLESFYWVLLWVLVRHVEYTTTPKKASKPNNSNPPLKSDDVCSKVFVYGDDYEAYSKKVAWIGLMEEEKGDYTLRFINNKPLTTLMANLRILVRYSIQGTAGGLTYDRVLALFDAALAKQGWPIDDKAKEYAEFMPRADSLTKPDPLPRVGSATATHSLRLPSIQEGMAAALATASHSNPLSSNFASGSQVRGVRLRKRPNDAVDGADEGRERLPSGVGTTSGAKRAKTRGV